MRKQLLLLLFCFSVAMTFAQQKVTGVVTSTEDGLPVIGASVQVKGTGQGTITDFDGKYSVQVSPKDILVFSYMGLETQSIKVGNRVTLNVVLKSSSVMVDEVVITAMGMKAEKKKLNFAVQSLDADEITAGESSNFVNSLQGKVAGLQVSTSGGSPNSSSPMVIRAISSINPGQSNEPLFIVDGMAISGGGTAAGDINPNDIENLTVLKGAAASALYGQEAANGVIMITTKSGKSGKMVVNASANVQFENAVRTPEIQNMYAPGIYGFSAPNVSGGWGPLLQPDEQTYDNVDNFLGTGLFTKYDINMAGGTEKFTSYASAMYSKYDGIVPNDYKNRMGFLLKSSYTPSKWLKINISLNSVETEARGFGSSMGSIYNWPVNDDMSNYKNNDGSMRWLYDMSLLDDSQKLNTPVNPNWGRYEDWSETKTTRTIVAGSIEWKPIKNLVLTGKISYEKNHSSYDSAITPRFTETDFVDPSKVDLTRFGQYTYSPSTSELIRSQLTASYEYKINRDFKINALVGLDSKEYNGVSGRMGGADFILPGEFYSLNNVNAISTDASLGYSMYLNHYEENKFGYFGEIRLDYRGIVHVSGTYRTDMASTFSNTSYSYPSVTAGVIFSELFHLSSPVFSYGKLRGNFAQVGKSGPRYKFDRTFKNMSAFPDGGFGLDPTVGASNELEPEMTSSWEIGADLRFFDSRTRLDLAYYSTTVDNQIVTVRVSPASGMILQTRNEGSIKNYGIEAQLQQDIFRGKPFNWTMGINFSLNRGKVVDLPDDIVEIQGTQYGDVFPTSYLNGSTTALSGKDYMRSPDGDILCKEDGTPMINPAKSVLIGNREPDFLIGMSQKLSWKNLSLSFLFDGRVGGDVINLTKRSLISMGQDKSLEKYRNREVIVDGVVEQADGSYLPNTTPMVLNATNLSTYFTGVSSNFIEDGSYLRLSYVTIGYNFDKLIKSNPYIKGLKCSVTGKNLFTLTKYTGSDPQVGTGSASGAGGFGIDYYQVPSTRSFNFTINATF
ncbi:MAG: SusC/RagA family TonB-linked outer membrane protein [Bacteroidaceae bacterium]|nr:SusC/RagA family TonB-linked outer membrane protein [Bacteroidaceae bacterium]